MTSRSSTGLRSLMFPTRTSASPSLIDAIVPVTANDTTRTLCPSPSGGGRRAGSAADFLAHFAVLSVFLFPHVRPLLPSALTLFSFLRYFLPDSLRHFNSRDSF